MINFSASFLLAFWIFSSCADEDSDKISPELRNHFAKETNSDAMIECQDLPAGQTKMENSLRKIKSLVSTSNTRLGPGSRGDDLTDMLNDLILSVRQGMSSLIDVLEQLGLEFEILWITNMIFVRRVTLEQVISIAGVQIVVRIRLPKIFRQIPSKPSPSKPITGNSTWNIGLINARCKSITCLGNNTIVGSLDTGAVWNHTELIGNWLNQPYGWWDGANKTVSPFPYDNGGHGTHTIGTMVGKNVGVAPGARWIACRLGEGDYFSDSAIISCAQFMACPWKWNDTSSKNCSVRPHVINNSYYEDDNGGFGAQELRPDNAIYKVWVMWNALGIMSTVAMGNFGPGCGTGTSPASYDIAMAVGAVDSTVTIAYFSSRGPAIMGQPFTKNSTAAGTCILPPSTVYSCVGDAVQNKPICIVTKPDIVAPGVNINSSWIPNTNSYISIMGTSMAAPHVAGVIALMVCANPNFAWNYTVAYNIITGTANTKIIDLKGVKQSASNSYAKSSNILCNVMADDMCDEYPNNVYGYGLVDACAAVKVAKDLK